MKKISIVTPCFNEEENVEDVYNEEKLEFDRLKEFEYEHIFIDNNSTDKTVFILKRLAAQDKNVKLILNMKNFGHIRSPFYGLIQAEGDAVILIVADLQDPPEMIPLFLKKWEEGHQIVAGVKNDSEENSFMFSVRKLFYFMMSKMSVSMHISNFTGFALYDQSFIRVLRTLDDPYPYFRGLVSELGSDICQLPYTQPIRHKGKTKNNFYSLYDMAMLGIVNYSKLPLRMACFVGFVFGIISFLIGVAYLVYKLIYWYDFELGIAPLVIGLFFFSSVQLFFIGIIGEYVGAVYTQVRKRPLVVEKERINF